MGAMITICIAAVLITVAVCTTTVITRLIDSDEDDAWRKVRELKEEIENLKKQENNEKED